MSESFRTRLMRIVFWLHPAYHGTGGNVTFIESDWSEVRVEIPLSWRTRNYVGTIFGGSMYAAVDPLYMIMLIQRLGPGYIVWDKSASIQFKRPGTNTLHAKFLLPDDEVETIKRELNDTHSVEKEYRVDLTDTEGVLIGRVRKTIYIRKR